MFDIIRVLELAEALGFRELQEYLPINKAEYVKFILYGE